MARWDPWRQDCWDMIRERKDCQFLFLTKRIERFLDHTIKLEEKFLPIAKQAF